MFLFYARDYQVFNKLSSTYTQYIKYIFHFYAATLEF